MRILTLFIYTCLSLVTGLTPAAGAISISPAGSVDTVKIGLLVTDNTSVSSVNGAKLALDEINHGNHSDNHFYEVVVKSMEGPWGTGSKQTVNLIYKDKIWAVLGSHDGRNAHLVEQVIAKQHYVFLSAWATDPTLSQAFVPWYFSCVYNDLQQAESLVEEIYNVKKYKRVGLVSDRGYDSKLAMESFEKVLKSKSKPAPVEYSYNSAKDIPDIAGEINKAGLSCVILFGKPDACVKIIRLMRNNNIKIPLYGTLAVMGEGLSRNEELSDYQGMKVVTSAGWLTRSATEFREDYTKAYGVPPDAVASYSYDGMKILVTAIKNSRFNIDYIKDAMLKIQYSGVTGTISFDERGNRSGFPKIVELKNGSPVTVYP